MKVIVNDANVLIDLVELGLLPHFFRLAFSFHTTALIMEELLEDQQDSLAPFIASGQLQVQSLSANQLQHIAAIQQQRTGLSTQDCSAFYQARELGGILLTSDNTLRKFARSEALEVHGHLWILDQMVAATVLLPQAAAQKLYLLQEEVNPNLGLPKDECQRRISQWARPKA